MSIDERMPTEALKKANIFILEIEQMVKDELAMLEKFYVSDHQDVPFEKAINKAKRKFEKRRGPTLIKPLNKKKNKVIVGEMEFDPVNNLWRGNDDDLNAFPGSRAPTALITNMNNGKNQERQIGDMKWDPKQKEWKGNESDLSKFRTLKPGLITQLNANLNTRVENGMVLDPISMKWRGNEEDADIFETMDDQNNDNTFKVEGEFNLTKALIQSLQESESKHIETLKGWFPEERDVEDREHLYSIRQMSIMKLIKNTTRPYSSGASGGVGLNSMSGSVLPLLNLKNNRKPVVDETNDWDDVDFDDQPTLQLNLKVHHDANDEKLQQQQQSDFTESDDWDKEMGFTSEDDTGTETMSGGGSRSHTPRLHLSSTGLNNQSSGELDKYKDSGEDEEEDMDWGALNKSLKRRSGDHSSLKNIFGGAIKNVLDSGSKSGSISLKRGGTLNNIPPLPLSSTTSTPNSNINNNNNNSNLGISNNSIYIEEFEEFDIPSTGFLSLKQKTHTDNFQLLETMSNASSSGSSIAGLNGNISASSSTRNQSPLMMNIVKDVVEEDWPDVHIPNDLSSKRPNDKSRKSSPPVGKNQVEDYSDELDLGDNFTANKPLELKKRNMLVDNPFGDDSDEDWDDVSFPDNFKASTPVQQPFPLNPKNNNNLNNNNTNNNKIDLTPNSSFSPLSPTSVNNILKTPPPTSPITPFKFIQSRSTSSFK